MGKRSWERWMKVVFAPHVAETGVGLEGAVGFEVWMGGLRGVSGGSDEEAGGMGEKGEEFGDVSGDRRRD